jgi:zinc D-Ala-D-Ala carboxypeptidase
LLTRESTGATLRTRLSKRIALGRLTHSDTALARNIDNTPRYPELRRLRGLALKLDAVECLLRRPVTITSGYRSRTLNARVGGVRGSQHTRGQAVDFQCARFGSPLEIARAIARAGIRFDQLIYEYGCNESGGWVHLSFAPRPRLRVLTICSSRRGYRRGLHPCFSCA